MKRLLGIATVLFILGAHPVLAVTCPGTLQLKDNAGTVTTGLYTNDGLGNCQANVATKDGSDAAEGATTDAAVTTNTTGSLSAKLRGIVAILADVWDSVNHRLHVEVDNTPAVTLSSTTLSAPNGDRAVAPTAITTAGTSSLTINTQGASMVQWSFSSFTTGTITFQLSDATGAAFNNTQCFAGASPYTLAGSVTTTNGSWFCPTGGAAVAKIVMSGGGGTATVSANAGSGDNLLALIAGNQAAIPPCGATPCTNNIGNVYQASQYPAGATPITASATGTTAATTATLAGVASHTTYICSLSIRANATAAATGNATVTGTITGTLNFTQWTAPNASGVGVAEQIYTPCVPASAQNTGIAVVSAAPGAGGVVSVTATGYQL